MAWCEKHWWIENPLLGTTSVAEGNFRRAERLPAAGFVFSRREMAKLILKNMQDKDAIKNPLNPTLTGKQVGTILALVFGLPAALLAISVLNGTVGGLLISILIFSVLFAIYLLPGSLAYHWGHKNRLAILLLNIFLGWTFVGWVAALVWAATKSK